MRAIVARKIRRLARQLAGDTPWGAKPIYKELKKYYKAGHLTASAGPTQETPNASKL